MLAVEKSGRNYETAAFFSLASFQIERSVFSEAIAPVFITNCAVQREICNPPFLRMYYAQKRECLFRTFYYQVSNKLHPSFRLLETTADSGLRLSNYL
jgi:hypothetical protein